MAISMAATAYDAKRQECSRDLGRVQATLLGSPTLDELVDCLDCVESWAVFWNEWGHDGERELCERLLAAWRPERERVQKLARKLLARDYPGWAKLIAATKAKQ
jgi:hypothetical protein